MHLKPLPLFQIRLENDILTMRGSQTESVGCVLRGQLVLAITEQTKFKEIKLTFQGISKVGWINISGKGQYFNNEEKILYQHDWSFLPVKEQQYHILKPDNYHWDFELVLPGTLPETIKRCRHGSIKYSLKAVAERHTFALNLHTRRKVTLIRSLLPSSLEYLQTAVVASNRAKFEYEVSANSKVFCLGDTISITINLSSLDKNLKVHSILCIFKEHVTYTIGVNQKLDSRIIGNLNICNFSQELISWCRLMEISIPNNPARCHYDSQNDTIRIDHLLRFYITLVNLTNYSLYELRASLPIIITSISPDSIINLPTYNDDGNDGDDDDNNYDNCDGFSDNSRSNSLSTFYSLGESSLHETLEGMRRMSKLPSYSIASSIPVPLSDSLLPPTYDPSSTNG